MDMQSLKHKLSERAEVQDILSGTQGRKTQKAPVVSSETAALLMQVGSALELGDNTQATFLYRQIQSQSDGEILSEKLQSMLLKKE